MQKLCSHSHKKCFYGLSFTLVLCLGLTFVSPGLPTGPISASETNSSPPNLPIASTKKLRSIPFSGTIRKLDTFEHSITLNGKGEGRVFYVVPDTKITRNNQPASLNGAVKGEEVGGAYKVSPEGKNIAVSLRLGPKPAATPTKKK